MIGVKTDLRLFFLNFYVFYIFFCVLYFLQGKLHLNIRSIRYLRIIFNVFVTLVFLDVFANQRFLRILTSDYGDASIINGQITISRLIMVS